MQEAVSPKQIFGEPLFQANDFVIYSKMGALNIRRVVVLPISQALQRGLSLVPMDLWLATLIAC